MIYLQLCFEFFKTGLFAIGGGLVTIPFLSEMGEKYGWFTSQELANMFAISESTPGPIGINMATYVGYKVAGVLGSIVATFSEVAPAIIIIIIVSKILIKFKESEYIKTAFKGLRPVVFGFILSAFVSIFTTSVILLDKYKETNNFVSMFDIRLIGIFLLILLLNTKWKIHPIFYVLLSGLLGIVFVL